MSMREYEAIDNNDEKYKVVRERDFINQYGNSAIFRTVYIPTYGPPTIDGHIGYYREYSQIIDRLENEVKSLFR